VLSILLPEFVESPDLDGLMCFDCPWSPELDWLRPEICILLYDFLSPPYWTDLLLIAAPGALNWTGCFRLLLLLLPSVTIIRSPVTLAHHTLTLTTPPQRPTYALLEFCLPAPRACARVTILCSCVFGTAGGSSASAVSPIWAMKLAPETMLLVS
jgi:hypothetical protein